MLDGEAEQFRVALQGQLAHGRAFLRTDSLDAATEARSDLRDAKPGSILGEHLEFTARQHGAHEIEPLCHRGVGDQCAHRRPDVALPRERRDDRHVNQIDPVALADQSVDTERDHFLQRVRLGFHGEYDEAHAGIAQLELPDDFEPIAVETARHV
jgi:hypothetical protein